MDDDSLKDLLKKLQGAIPELKKVANVSFEGTFSEAMLPKGLNKERVATMAASMFSISERLIIEMGKGEIDQLHVKGGKGYFMVIHDGPNIALKISKTRNDRDDNHTDNRDENSGLGARLVNSY